MVQCIPAPFAGSVGILNFNNGALLLKLMNQPLVSIVVACHNRAHLLPQTMGSIFAQSYRPVEIVVVDDGSIDETPQLMETYGNKIRYIRQQNQGAAVARTTGGRLAKGEFIAFQDDDDLMVPDRIYHLMHGFEQYPRAILSVGDYAFLDSDGNLTGVKGQFQIHEELKDPDHKPILIEDGYTAVLWPKLTPLPHTTLFRKKDADKINWFDPRFFYACSDTDFFARLGRLGAIAYVPEIVSYYRFGHTSIWKNKILATYSQYLLFEKHLKSMEKVHKMLRKQIESRLCTTLKRLATFEKHNDVSDIFPGDLFYKGLDLLRSRYRLDFRFYKAFIIPLRSKILGTNLDISIIDYLFRKLKPLKDKN